MSECKGYDEHKDETRMDSKDVADEFGDKMMDEVDGAAAYKDETSKRIHLCMCTGIYYAAELGFSLCSPTGVMQNIKTGADSVALGKYNGGLQKLVHESKLNDAMQNPLQIHSIISTKWKIKLKRSRSTKMLADAVIMYLDQHKPGTGPWAHYTPYGDSAVLIYVPELSLETANDIIICLTDCSKIYGCIFRLHIVTLNAISGGVHALKSSQIATTYHITNLKDRDTMLLPITKHVLAPSCVHVCNGSDMEKLEKCLGARNVSNTAWILLDDEEVKARSLQEGDFIIVRYPDNILGNALKIVAQSYK